jgi:hypothetical protein
MIEVLPILAQVPPDWSDPDRITVIALLLGAFLLGMKKKWVWGWAYDAMESDRDYWKGRALDLLLTSKEAVSVAEEAIQ